MKINMTKKGQAAMEFLMTYGWAILVVLAAIGALAYFGVLSPDQLLPERCTGPSGMDCLEKASVVASTDTVSFVSRNNLGNDINITAAALSGSDNTCSGVAQAVTVSVEGAAAVNINTTPQVQNGETFVINYQCASGQISTGRYSGDIAVSYISENGLTNVGTFSIRGKAA